MLPAPPRPLRSHYVTVHKVKLHEWCRLGWEPRGCAWDDIRAWSPKRCRLGWELRGHAWDGIRAWSPSASFCKLCGDFYDVPLFPTVRILTIVDLSCWPRLSDLWAHFTGSHGNNFLKSQIALSAILIHLWIHVGK